MRECVCLLLIYDQTAEGIVVKFGIELPNTLAAEKHLCPMGKSMEVNYFSF